MGIMFLPIVTMGKCVRQKSYDVPNKFPEHIQANVKFMKNIGTAAKRSPDLN